MGSYARKRACSPRIYSTPPQGANRAKALVGPQPSTEHHHTLKKRPNRLKRAFFYGKKNGWEGIFLIGHRHNAKTAKDIDL